MRLRTGKSAKISYLLCVLPGLALFCRRGLLDFVAQAHGDAFRLGLYSLSAVSVACSIINILPTFMANCGLVGYCTVSS